MAQDDPPPPHQPTYSNEVARIFQAKCQICHRTGDIATALGTTVSGIGPVRAKLIRKGMIYSPAHGDMAFTVPLFDEFMVRAIPDFTPGKQLAK